MTKTAAAADPPAPPVRRGRPARPAITQPALLDTRRRVNGLAVVDEQPVKANLPARPGEEPKNLRFNRLILEDGAVVYECCECPFTGTRGELQKHRAEDHGGPGWGTNSVKRRPSAAAPSADALSYTLGELLDMAEAFGTWGATVERLTQQRDEWRTRASDAERTIRRYLGIFDRMGFVPKDLDTKETDQ